MSKDEASEVINEAVEKQPKDKKKSRLRRIGRFVGVLFVLFLIWYVFVGRSVPPRISKETTYVTEPRTPDGKWIDYCGAYEQLYYPPEMKTDDNGYRMIVRHLGLPIAEFTYYDVKTREQKSYDFDNDVLRAQGYEKLGLDPNLKPDMKMLHTEVVMRDYAKKIHPDDDEAAIKLQWELYNRVMGQFHNSSDSVSAVSLGPEETQSPWTLEKYPMMQPWLEQTSPVLDMVGEAVAKPTFRVPLVGPESYESLYFVTLHGSLGIIQEFRSFAREYMARFQYRLGQGDIDGAIADKIATHRLGRHAGRQASLVNYLVGVAIDGMGYAEGIADNMDAQPTAEQIRRLMQLQDELPPAITLDEAMESERLVVLDALQVYARGKPSSPGDVMPPEFLRPWVGLALDWNVVFRRANQYLDGELIPTAVKPAPFGYLASFLYSRKKRSESFIDIQAALFVPAVEAAHEAQRRHECTGNMQRITLAMLLYHAENGTLPPAFLVDETDKPLHSWRVLLLPYLGDAESAALYGQIRLDEPWDSEHNRQFHEKSLSVYRCPSCENRGLEPGQTSYCVIIGDDTPFGGDGIGKSLDGFGPNSGGMPLVTESRSSSNWMDPTFDVAFEQAKEGISGQKRFDYDASNPHLPKETAIGSYHAGGANFGLRSGGVGFFSETIAPELWQNVLTGKEKAW